MVCFCKYTATTEIYTYLHTLSLHDALPISFHNACTHLGNKLWQKLADSSAFVKCGNKKYFTCEFHGWVFSDKGDVVDIPDQENFFDLDKQALGLVPIHIAFWEGFIFVNFAEQPHLTLDEQLGGLKEQPAGYPFDSYKIGRAHV